MLEQFGPPSIVKLTFPLDLDWVSRSRYLIETRHGSLIAFRQRIASHGGDVTERLARMAVKIATKKLVDCTCLGAISLYTEVGQFGQPVLETVGRVHYLITLRLLHMQQPHQGFLAVVVISRVPSGRYEASIVGL